MIEILYEDNHILVAVKPAMLPSQEDASKDSDMLSLVKKYVKQEHDKPGNVYIGLLHRLDRPAQGVMVFAKTSKAASRLSKDIKEDRFYKAYLAVVNGAPGAGVYRDYLLKDSKTNSSSVVKEDRPGAKYCELSFKTLEQKDGRALVEILLKTGRSHQIRVQFSSRGFPLVGDVKYGLGEKVPLALCSYKLGFMHPVKKEYMEFKYLPRTEPFTDYQALNKNFL